MADDTEETRRQLVEMLAISPGERPELESLYGQVWDTTELQKDFTVHGFLAPFVHVTRKSDGVVGSLMFQHLPRFYFEFKEFKS